MRKHTLGSALKSVVERHVPDAGFSAAEDSRGLLTTLFCTALTLNSPTPRHDFGAAPFSAALSLLSLPPLLLLSSFAAPSGFVLPHDGVCVKGGACVVSRSGGWTFAW